MNKTRKAPKTLLQAVRYFADADTALHFLADLRWPNGPICPKCEADKPSFLKTRRIWKCRSCKKQFSVKVGTIFEDSPISLDKWLPALWMLANCKNGISSYELARALGVTQKTGWFMLHRIRLAMASKTFQTFSGEVEADETFIGGLSKFMHRSKRKRVIRVTGPSDKVAVLGVLQRGDGEKHSRVIAEVAHSRKRHPMQEQVRQRVKAGSALYTDAFPSYRGMERDYLHAVIDHAVTYVRGKVHTNGLENFWSLLKRTIKGTYVAIDPFHVPAYLDEQVHRFNNRKDNDAGRFVSVLRAIVGKRLTYRSLIGSALPTPI